MLPFVSVKIKLFFQRESRGEWNSWLSCRLAMEHSLMDWRGRNQLTQAHTHKQVYTANTGLLYPCQQCTCQASLWACTAYGIGMCPKKYVRVCEYSCGVSRMRERKQTFPIFHRSPETQLEQKAYKSVTHSYTHTTTHTHTHEPAGVGLMGHSQHMTLSTAL